jgi:uroporphyrinogen-III synthase
VQEYGRTNSRLLDELVERGARVQRVPVYHWDLPEDVAPLRSGIQRFAAGEIDAVLFTSARQVDHVMRVAEDLGLGDAVLRAARDAVVASIGPVCSEALGEQDWPVDIEPEHPKMGHLVNALAKRCREVIDGKRAPSRQDRP